MASTSHAQATDAHDQRHPGEASWIARERLGPGRAPAWWTLTALAIAALTFAVLAALAQAPGDRVAAEAEYQETDGFLQALGAWADPATARIWSAAAGAASVLATAIATRRILHHDLGALLAAGLVALDGAMLQHGRFATPVAPATAAALVALALFVQAEDRWHWWGAGALTFACLLEPLHVLWGVPLALMLLTRGHIYAAPHHAIQAGLQALVVPAIGAVMGIIGASSLRDGCYQAARDDALLITQSVDLGGFHAVPNPVTWFAGLGALVYLGLLAATHLLGRFRLQRLPGRIQVRLPDRMRRMYGRALWLVALAVFAPTPLLWVPVFSMALAAAVIELGRDSRAFGVVVGVVLVIFAAAYTLQNGGTLVDGGGLLPWTQSAVC